MMSKTGQRVLSPSAMLHSGRGQMCSRGEHLALAQSADPVSPPYPFLPERRARTTKGFPMTTPSKCAHPACNCVPPAYCSESCADAKRILEIPCQCQPAGCQGQKLKP